MANENPEPEPTGGMVDPVVNNATPSASAQRKGSEEPRKAATATTTTTTPTTPTPSAPPPLKTQAINNLARASSPSPANSPRGSRNASPIRKESRTQSYSTPLSTQPSAAAIQRALSATNPPQLQQTTVTDAVAKLPRPLKSAGAPNENTPHWPTSPRLKSPPPSGTNSRRGSGAPSINVQATSNPSPTPAPAKQASDDAPKTNHLQTAAKAPSRGASGKSTLETVQENSADDIKDASPAAIAAAAELKPLTKLSDDETAPAKRDSPAADTEKPAQHVESGSESAGTRSPQKKDASQQAQRPRNTQSKSYASLGSTKSRQADIKQNMTVETETVPSVPQSALTAGDRSGAGRGENSGSVKQKTSSEAIRPKKERKRPAPKARSINQGTTSSKADIFEQRVANAVDEANSSESDETFVYESNPPEPQRRVRHHSRTPSVNSSHSVAEQQHRGSIRNFGEVLDENRRVGGKRSMKFSNNAYPADPDAPDGADGSTRSHTPRHFGRFGRGGSQQSMFDPDSPFTQASKLRTNQRSKPSSPKSPLAGQGQQRTSALFGRKREPEHEFDAEVGDDERTPLVGTVRTAKNSKPMGRRGYRSPSIDEYYGVRRRSRCGRYGGCLLATVVVIAVIFSTIAFLVMSNRPLYEVEILEIRNVLASEQELILDLFVSAVNPNALSITVTKMDIDIFAKSKHVGSGGRAWSDPGPAALTSSVTIPKRRRRRRGAESRISAEEKAEGWQDLSEHWHSTTGGVDKGTDPPDREAQTMLLGRVFEFEQALAFEGSPLKRNAHNSTGELRLDKPGNKTETGGSARWERVLQHDFELIVRGSLKYQLPISSRLQSVAVAKSVIVYPEDDIDEDGHMRTEPVDHSEHWQWIDWDEVDGTS